MNAKISVFVICVEAIIYLLLYNLRDCTFDIDKILTKYFNRSYRTPPQVFCILMNVHEFFQMFYYGQYIPVW